MVGASYQARSCANECSVMQDLPFPGRGSSRDSGVDAFGTGGPVKYSQWIVRYLAAELRVERALGKGSPVKLPSWDDVEQESCTLVSRLARNGGQLGRGVSNSGELEAATTLCCMFLVMARDKEFEAGVVIGVKHASALNCDVHACYPCSIEMVTGTHDDGNGTLDKSFSKYCGLK
ncbi:hypothetical protein BR93DRAFT_732552 [Coniochaeta sp. PMI_546]|nr:hypothetical protein BR93DRAFT_732552 [Coniochaeta sp. PMI_546]